MVTVLCLLGCLLSSLLACSINHQSFWSTLSSLHEDFRIRAMGAQWQRTFEHSFKAILCLLIRMCTCGICVTVRVGCCLLVALFAWVRACICACLPNTQCIAHTHMYIYMDRIYIYTEREIDINI